MSANFFTIFDHHRCHLQVLGNPGESVRIAGLAPGRGDKAGHSNLDHYWECGSTTFERGLPVAHLSPLVSTLSLSDVQGAATVALESFFKI